MAQPIFKPRIGLLLGISGGGNKEE
jgi:hypothetical protein